MFVYMFMFMLVNKEKCSYYKWKFYVVQKKKKGPKRTKVDPKGPKCTEWTKMHQSGPNLKLKK